ncbi:MAG: hypothetical protein IKK81_04210 [Prevotella sp.]|nr:hypothetical protein [Prevotella sp.]
MGPISSYKELIQTLNWDDKKRKSERWYIFLLMNPQNQTNAGIDIIKNFSYLNARTGNVTFFLPGFSNMEEGIVPYCSNHGREIIYQDESFGNLYFDERGFLGTIEWLETGSHFYRYSEGLDLVIIKYRPRYTEGSTKMYEQNFDLQNMIVFNVDRLKNVGINTLRMITECMHVVSQSQIEREVKQRLEEFVFSNTETLSRHLHQTINVFVAGAKVLKRERDAVISALTHITNNSSRDYVFRVKTYEDFDISLSDEGRQKEYNEYISNDTEYAIFVLDSTVGGITLEEFEVAMNAYRTRRRPEIFVYSRMPNSERWSFSLNFRRHEQSKDVTAIRRHLSEIGQYYIEYRDIDDLKNHIAQDFRRYSL